MGKRIIITVGIIVLLYTRLIGLTWGLPYPMHPDERNMANAVQGLNCDISASKFQISDCYNPHFFAYGQFPLYVGYAVVGIMKFLDGDMGLPIGFQEATVALRIIAAASSILSVFVLLKLIKFLKIRAKSKTLFVFAFLLLAFSPYFIQFSHFGTTESLLMLFYSLVVYFSLKKISSDNEWSRVDNFLLTFFCGLAIATKISSVVFLILPLVSTLWKITITNKKKVVQDLYRFIKFILGVMLVFVTFSPHTIISFPEFMSSVSYESSVALGAYLPFYTRQFVDTTPIVFQLVKIFPYALGWPQFILALSGFVFLSWKNKYFNFLRFSFLIFFIPTAFIFAKWSRFMAPVFPLTSVFAILFVYKMHEWADVIPMKIGIQKKLHGFRIRSGMTICSIFIVILPGIAYLSVYQQPDVRFKASQWIYSHISPQSKILSETANVIDIPIPPPHFEQAIEQYQNISFNFYDLDASPVLQKDLNSYEQLADYIFIPSRRIFMNHPLGTYPVLNNYYQRLLNGSLGYEKVAEFSSYPRIEILGKTVFEFPDENAEETWTVFDHPVIRIYKKNSKLKIENSNQIQNLKNYKKINYRLTTNDYQLLVADIPAKWEQGLMFVRGKKDIGGLDGMLFVFPESSKKMFWNKNTVSNLDLYWINNDKQVGMSSLPSIEKSNQIVTVSSPEKVNKVIEIIKE